MLFLQQAENSKSQVSQHVEEEYYAKHDTINLEEMPICEKFNENFRLHLYVTFQNNFHKALFVYRQTRNIIRAVDVTTFSTAV